MEGLLDQLQIRNKSQDIPSSVMLDMNNNIILNSEFVKFFDKKNNKSPKVYLVRTGAQNFAGHFFVGEHWIRVDMQHKDNANKRVVQYQGAADLDDDFNEKFKSFARLTNVAVCFEIDEQDLADFRTFFDNPY